MLAGCLLYDEMPYIFRLLQLHYYAICSSRMPCKMPTPYSKVIHIEPFRHCSSKSRHFIITFEMMTRAPEFNNADATRTGIASLRFNELIMPPKGHYS